MSKRRVVVTGLGTINPLANNVLDTWKNLINGVSGIDYISSFETDNLPVTFAGEVKNFDANEYMGKQQDRKLDRSGHLSIYATEEALKDAKLDVEQRLGSGVGIVFGTGIGGIGATEQAVRTYDERGASRINPLAITQLMPNSSTGQVAIKFGIEGPSLTITTACAASANAIGEAKNMIQNGIVNMVIAGGTESGTTAMTIGAFAQIRALSTNNKNPKEACRPFDKDRDGFVLGEGAGALILEEYEHAIGRGAKIYAELIGGGLSCDAYHMTAPHPDGRGAIKVMKNCLDDANINTSDVDLINMHGTSTPLGDLAESIAVKDVFQDDVYNLNINSTKSMTGHLLGAAGAIEAISCIMAIKHGIIPPTINHFNDDENIDHKLNFTFSSPQKKIVDVAMSNTFGFGGHNACVIFRKLD